LAKGLAERPSPITCPTCHSRDVGNNYQTNIQMTQNPKIYRIDKKNRMLENSLNCLLTIEK